VAASALEQGLAQLGQRLAHQRALLSKQVEETLPSRQWYQLHRIPLETGASLLEWPIEFLASFCVRPKRGPQPELAAALFNRHARGRAVARLGGTRPATHVHPEVVEVMREVGVDLASAHPQLMTADLAAGAARVSPWAARKANVRWSALRSKTGPFRPRGQPLETVRAS